METVGMLELFDRQMRRDFAGGPMETHGRTRILVAPGFKAVLWSDLDEQSADDEIAGAVARLRELPGHVEWKLFAHDRPPDLAERLAAAGLVAEEEEVLLVADAAALPTVPAADVRVADDAAGVATFMELQERVFGERPEWLERELLDALEQDAPPVLAVVAFVDGEPASGARIDLPPHSDFAGLFGGATLPSLRGRGLYRATVARRAELARERGYRYVYVEALPTSAPILRRLGFVQLSATTPFVPYN